MRVEGRQILRPARNNAKTDDDEERDQLEQRHRHLHETAVFQPADVDQQQHPDRRQSCARLPYRIVDEHRHEQR
jgi:hypothetical protein